MGMLKHNKETSDTPAPAEAEKGRPSRAVSGRSIMAYFLPVGLVAAVMLGLITLLAVQQLGSTQEQAERMAAQSAAQSLASRVSGLVQARQEVLGLVSHSAAVRKALLAKDKQLLASTTVAAQQLLPEVLQLRLFPQALVSPDPQGKAPMGFAGVDMVRRALEGKAVAAEIHQIDAGRPYLALARSVKQGKQVVGAVFAAWPVTGLRQVAQSALAADSQLWLVQGGNEGFVVAGNASKNPPPGASFVPVTDTVWNAYYNPSEPGLSPGVLMLWGLSAGGILLVLLVLYLKQRVLARDLRADMSTLVSLGEAIAEGSAVNEPDALVATSSDAVVLLKDLVRRSHAQPRKAAPSESGTPVPRPAPAGETAAPTKASGFSDSTGIQVEESEQRPPVTAPPEAFRAYDIRGITGKHLTTEFALGLGWAFAEMAHENGVQTVYVAHDARLSSPELYDSLCVGLAEGGMRVIELGMSPAALLYYAMHTDADTEAGAVMVTGSHNPVEYNGFKLFLRTESVQGEDLQQLRERMSQGGFELRPGSREKRDLKRDYLDAIAQELTLARQLSVVVDGGNGAAGELACAVLGVIGCEVTPLYCEPDGSFPNHHPDPGQPENLRALQEEVLARGADLGIAFDGDGDRIGVIDDRGELVWPEHLLMLLAADILRRNPGSDVIYDVKSSRHLAGFVLAQGGRPIMWRSGHTRMREKMRETGALIGGEFAGHFYIKERWYGSDDALYVAARLLEVLADDPRPVHEQVAELPHTPATPEYQLPLAEGESGGLMQAIVARASFPEARIIDLDGLRVEFPQAWGLVRASNTVPSLTFRFEADNEAELEGIKQRFRDLLSQAAPGKAIPF